MGAPKILVVDDDPAISEMLVLVLKTEGLQAIPVLDGAEAVSAFEQHQPDLVLLDLMLPGMNGIDICRVIRQNSTVPIIPAPDSSASADTSSTAVR